MKKTALLLAMLFLLFCLPQSAFCRTVGEMERAERLAVCAAMPETREDEAFLLTDDCAYTYVAFASASTVRFSFSDEAACLVTVWETEPERVLLTCYAGETMLSQSALDVPYLSVVTDLPAGTTDAELTFETEASLSEVRAYTAGNLPETEYLWEKAEHPDVLLVVAYPGDEYRFFGGLLPRLIDEGVNVAVCYFSDYSRGRLEEGFSALWSLGLNTYPVRLGVDARLSLGYKELKKNWKGEKPEERFQKQLLALHPAIVIAPSDKEDAAEARLASELVQNVCAANPDAFSKLYLAESCEGAITLSDEPLLCFGNQSGNRIAQRALNGFHSVAYWEYAIRAEGSYRLAQTQVGEDTQTASLFEHVSVELNPPVTPTPIPTEVPEPTEQPTRTQAPTIAPSEAPKASVSPTAAQKRGWLSCAGKEITPSPTESPTPVLTSSPTAQPTEKPTPEPTEEPTPEPTEEPTPAPEKFAGHFLNEGEPEQFTMDRENGRWTFRDQSIDMDIRRVASKDSEGAPQIYFVAHIWMRSNQHRSGFGQETRTGRTREKAYGIARRYGAVLLITGDNLINFEEAWTLRSTLIRDGEIYMHKSGEAVMAWNDRTLSFDLFPDRTFTTNDLLERGYRDVYCFGPILMQDGEIMPRLDLHRLSGNNPRTGVGQVEPGHIVVIVVDGKKPGVANGMQLADFAALFKAEGCVSAYNLDGGLSTDIVFMGEHLRERKEKRNLPDALLFGHTDLLPNESDPAPEHYEIGTDENGRTVIVPKKH